MNVTGRVIRKSFRSKWVFMIIAVTTRLKQLLKLLTVHNRRMDPGWIGKELDDQIGQFFRIDIFLTPSATTIFCAE